MASKVNRERKPGTILADSNQARYKAGFGTYGFNSDGTRPAVTKAAKMSDMWFIEFTKPGDNKANVSEFAKAVSPINVTTESVSVDKYGKRVHIPTYVNFSEVTVQFYDKVDGSGFTFAEEIYKNFFSNAELSADADSIQATITQINSGRKFPSNAEERGFYRSFEKVSIYHFFGNLDAGGQGTVQKIDLVNPLVTNISFSGSDYSDSSLRTIDISLQPENVIFGTPTENPAVPEWMSQGLEYIIQDLNTDNSQFVTEKLRETLNLKFDNQLQGLINKNVTDITGAIDNDNTAKQQLQELKKLSSRLKYLEGDSTSTPGERQEALEAFLEQRRNTMPMKAEALTNFRRSDTSNTPYSSDILYPNVADFPTARTQAGGTDRFTSIDLANLVTNELITSFLNGRSINMDNITNGVARGILGNTGIGTLTNLGRTSQSKFGVAGDFVRDSLIRSTRLGVPAEGLKTTTISSRPVSQPTSSTPDFGDKDLDKAGLQFNQTSRTNTQNNIQNLKNLTRGIR